ncbi:MAG: hypothetical protein ACOX2X_05925 [Peptococcia bacterium]|jgi:hypothetical protein
MSILITDILLWLVAILVGIYTWLYAMWLWRQQQKRGAFGVAVIAVFAVLYSGYVLFFVH